MNSSSTRSAVLAAVALGGLFLPGRARAEVTAGPLRLPLPAFASPTPEETDAAIARRRSRLLLHQGLGFATEAAGLAALVVSILDDRDRFGPGGRTQAFKTWEMGFAIATETLTLGNFLLAATAPEPFEHEEQVDATLLHKVLMFSAAFLQAAKVVLSVLLYSAPNPAGVEGLVLMHRIATYGAPAFFLAGSLAQVF